MSKIKEIAKEAGAALTIAALTISTQGVFLASLVLLR